MRTANVTADEIDVIRFSFPGYVADERDACGRASTTLTTTTSRAYSFVAKADALHGFTFIAESFSSSILIEPCNRAKAPCHHVKVSQNFKTKVDRIII